MTLLDHLDQIEDTRKDIKKSYELTDIIFLTMAAVRSGATGWKDINLFGNVKIDCLRQTCPFAAGIPTRHSIGRIIRSISAEVLMECFAVWINQQGEDGAKNMTLFKRILINLPKAHRTYC